MTGKIRFLLRFSRFFLKPDLRASEVTALTKTYSLWHQTR